MSKTKQLKCFFGFTENDTPTFVTIKGENVESIYIPDIPDKTPVTLYEVTNEDYEVIQRVCTIVNTNHSLDMFFSESFLLIKKALENNEVTVSAKDLFSGLETFFSLKVKYNLPDIYDEQYLDKQLAAAKAERQKSNNTVSNMMLDEIISDYTRKLNILKESSGTVIIN